MKYLEIKGDTIDAAVESALVQLGLSRDDVSVEVLKQPKSGFLGFGKEPALVRVSYETTPTARAVDFLQGLLIRFGTPADIHAEEDIREHTIALTLTGDILKGFLPVFLFMHRFGPETAPLLCAPVIAAPVAGHTFPVFRHFRGGKGIAVTFGCLLGLMPNLMPFLLFAGSFILFSTVIVITPHFQRTLAAYALTLGLLLCGGQPAGIAGGFLLITVLTSIRFHKSPEIRETMAFRLFRRAS